MALTGISMRSLFRRCTLTCGDPARTGLVYTRRPSSSASNIQDLYQKKTQVEHVLLRPGTYIGSVSRHTRMVSVRDNRSKKMVPKELSYIPGMYKIVDEILVNASDHHQRGGGVSKIDVFFSAEENKVTVRNDGTGIPVVLHEQEKVYIPELVFGHMLTSSNYDDHTDRITGGLNGFGAKLTNIFSDELLLETSDKESGFQYRQTFSDNMGNRSEPLISPASGPDYTMVSFRPSLKYFHVKKLDDSLHKLVEKRVHDMAACFPGIAFTFNGSAVDVGGFADYASMHLPTETPFVHERINHRWEMAIAASNHGEFEHLSFVNGIWTGLGGTHVSHLTEQVVDYIADHIAKKEKDHAASIRRPHIRSQISIFVNANVRNPSFESQSKESLTTDPKEFDTKPRLSDKFLKSIVLNTGIVDNVLMWAKARKNMQLERSLAGTKKRNLKGIPKLEDANWAGTSKSNACTLILTEGDSAKALAMSGLSVVGRDRFGVYPLRGKLLNVRDASHRQIMNNAEIEAMVKIMGLELNAEYNAESVSKLRYGHIMLMTDQDHDGSHIKGLVINMLHHFWPSLLQVDGFLQEFITPIVKVRKGRATPIPFYSMHEYDEWRDKTRDCDKYSVKYYKGLGTSTGAEGKEYFNNIDKHRKLIRWDEEEKADSLVELAFGKSKSDQRKGWLLRYDADNVLDNSNPVLLLSDFINKELIQFSMADNIRSIPSVVDGLKPGQRKIMHSCFKRDLTSEVKVAQLAGYVAEHSAYHHGEVSLASTIVGLAQNFVGSNNINLLEPRGQFGTRLEGGKDAASPRYIYTQLADISKKLFPPEDNPLLDYSFEDGMKVEPKYFAPVIPMVLVNGAEGIGTGWSTFVACYNPREIIAATKAAIAGQEAPPMVPWYRGFTGTITPAPAKGYFQVVGGLKTVSGTPGSLLVDELPVRTWTQRYKEFLAEMVNKKALSRLKEHHTETKVHFEFQYLGHLTGAETLHWVDNDGGEGKGKKAKVSGRGPEEMMARLEKAMKLRSQISTNNMHLFNARGEIHRYTSPEEILAEFVPIRMQVYEARREHQLARLQADIDKLDNQVLFVDSILSSSLQITNRSKQQIIDDMVSLGIVPQADGQSSTPSFNYLFRMQLFSLTAEMVDSLKEQHKTKLRQLKKLQRTSAADLWMKDLDALEEALPSQDL